MDQYQVKLSLLIGIIGVFGTILGLVLFVTLKKKTPEIPEASTLSQSPQQQQQQQPEQPKSQESSPSFQATRNQFWGRIQSLFVKGHLPELDELEEILYTSDLGPKTVQRLLAGAEPQLKSGMTAVHNLLKSEISNIFQEAKVLEPVLDQPLNHLKQSKKPTVWLIVGVNGAGKTTSIGKISSLLASQGLKVLVAAGDTFRAAAGSQLKVWTDRAQVEIFSPENINDPSAVAFDAVSKAVSKDYDVVLIDTAGRLHTQSHLMDELKKVKRVITKVIPEGPAEILIVLDANNGQNALNQAREFHQAIGLTGVILTKMDGTAKGGVAVGVCHELKIPVRLIGIGEKIGDLKAFSSTEFVDAIFSEI